MLQTTKQNFFKEHIELFKGDSKNFWKLLGNLLGHKSSSNIERVYYHRTHNLCPEDQTANVINNCFVQIGKYDLYNTNAVSNRVSIDPTPDSELVNFTLLDCNSFLEIIKDLNENKSSGI